MIRSDGMHESPSSAGEPVIVEAFDLAIKPAEVQRLLGRKGGRPADMAGRFDGVIAEAIERAGALIAPKGVYVYAAGAELAGSSVFAELERMAFAVCTIGPALESEVTRLSAADELLHAVVLDAVGSVAAEAAAEWLSGQIARQCAAGGLNISCRASPGYGNWDVREQRAIFALVPAERIGVRLSESCMMMPRKSVSFAVNIAAEPVALRSEHSCQNCPRTQCPYRR